MRAHDVVKLLYCIVGIALAQDAPPNPPNSGSATGPTATSPGDQPPQVSENAVRLTGFDKCDQRSKDFIWDAWDEFEKMVPEEPSDSTDDAPLQYPWFDETSAPALDFWGPSTRFSQFSKRTKKNLDNLASVRRGWATFWTVHVRCDDPYDRCRKPDPCEPIDPGDPDSPLKRNLHTAYTMHRDPYKNHINFCPDFFHLPALDSRIDAISQIRDRRDNLDEYRNRAFTMTHELLHIDWIGKPIDYDGDWLIDVPMPNGVGAYRAIDAKYLAYGGTPPYEHVNNVNNYVYYLLAKYINHRKRFYPSSPVWTSDHDPPALAQVSEEFNGTDISIDFEDC